MNTKVPINRLNICFIKNIYVINFFYNVLRTWETTPNVLYSLSASIVQQMLGGFCSEVYVNEELLNTSMSISRWILLGPPEKFLSLDSGTCNDDLWH